MNSWNFLVLIINSLIWYYFDVLSLQATLCKVYILVRMFVLGPHGSDKFRIGFGWGFLLLVRWTYSYRTCDDQVGKCKVVPAWVGSHLHERGSRQSVAPMMLRCAGARPYMHDAYFYLRRGSRLKECRTCTNLVVNVVAAFAICGCVCYIYTNIGSHLWAISTAPAVSHLWYLRPEKVEELLD